MSHIHTHNCDCAEASKGPGDLYSLFQNVAMDSVRVLNEDVAESGKKIIKPFDQRLNDDTVVRGRIAKHRHNSTFDLLIFLL